jgi:hypothetical protein
MKTITMTAYRRPDYTVKALSALSTALAYAADKGIHYDDIYISVDSGHEQSEAVRQVVSDWSPPHNHPKKVNVWRLHQSTHLGIDANTEWVINAAFDMGKSSFNLHLEDDIVISPDALLLCEWYRLDPPGAEDALTLGIASSSRSPAAPLFVAWHPIFSPYGWACRRHNWLYHLRPQWNHKKHDPRGWDWSISHYMYRHGFYSIHPLLSRALNIGAKGGTYETPEHHARNFDGIVAAGLNTGHLACQYSDFHLFGSKPERGEWEWND